MASSGVWTRQHEIVPGTLVMIATGRPDATFGNWVDKCLAEAFATNARLTVVYDLKGVENYDSEARLGVTEAMVRVLPRLDRFVVFTHSRLVAMGAMVVNMALAGKALVHNNDEAFQREMSAPARAALARLRAKTR